MSTHPSARQGDARQLQRAISRINTRIAAIEKNLSRVDRILLYRLGVQPPVCENINDGLDVDARE